MSKNYSAKDIQVVPAKIAIRERVHLYTEGNTFGERWNWLVTEIVKSAANPEMGNHASQIVVIVQEDNTVTIKDNGRGLPVYCSNQQGTIVENIDQTRDQVIRPSIEFTLTSVYAGVPNRETYEREVFGSFTLDYQDLVQRCNEVQNRFGAVIECRKE